MNRPNKLLLLLLVLCLCSSLIFAHGDVEEEERHDSVNPFEHFAHGSIIPGILFSVMWIGIVFGVIILLLLVGSRLFV